MSEANDGDRPAPIKAFVSFPSPYTQTLLIQALVATLESIFISLLPPDEQDPPQLQWHVSRFPLLIHLLMSSQG